MPITHIFRSGCRHRCDGCGALRHLDLDQLEVGVMPHSTPHIAHDEAAPVIALPPCDACGGVEFLTEFGESDRPPRLRFTAGVRELMRHVAVDDAAEPLPRPETAYLDDEPDLDSTTSSL